MNKIKEAKKRWSKAMPKFFKTVTWISGLVSGTAMAINAAFMQLGYTPEWWQDICYPIIAFSAGVMFACKFTVNGGMDDKSKKQ